jgi:hypothetical protein
MAVATLSLHELRSSAELGGHTHAELARYAHGYIATLTLAVAVLVALASAHLLVRLAFSMRSADAARYVARPGRPLWLWAAITLLGISLGQDLVESLVAAGDPSYLADVFGHGGWTTMPLALLFGGGVALAVRGSDTALALASRGRRQRVGGTAMLRSRRPLPAGHQRFTDPLADAAAGRAPPPGFALS